MVFDRLRPQETEEARKEQDKGSGSSYKKKSSIPTPYDVVLADISLTFKYSASPRMVSLSNVIVRPASPICSRVMLGGLP